MTAVASPPSFSNINRPAWGGQSLSSMNTEEVRGIFMPPRKTIQRTNSASSIASTSSNSSTATVAAAAPQTNGTPVSAAGDLSGWPNGAARKRPQPKSQWQAGKPDGQPDFVRMPGGRPQVPAGVNGTSSLHQPSPIVPSQGQIMNQGGGSRPAGDQSGLGQPMLCLLSLNGTFEQKKISVPFYPETLRIGRQTNAKTVPTPANGFFDSKVLSRQHAEIWADRNGKIWIRDVKSSNGTFVNGQRLSQENRESEPHELQSQDQLELGIDIVSEDQKTVVHHKVAAKVEHAGFMNPSANLLDMNFGDLDPSNGTMMMPMGGMPMRGRAGNQASVGSNSRMGPNAGIMNGQANGLGHQRQFWLTPITTEHIVKKLHSEMRNARLQSQDLNRTGQFISALLSKDDIKHNEKPEVPEPPKSHMVNGNGVSFRPEGKPRFSDPPAPPPQQPLPEKPDVPSLKRGTTERPKSHPPNASTTSPIRQDNLSQIIALQEALNNAKREMDTQTAKMRELEENLQKEREARENAEVRAQRLEDAAASRMNGAPKTSEQESVLEEAFEPPPEAAPAPEPEMAPAEQDKGDAAQAEKVEAASNLFQARIDSMILEMRDLKQQLDEFKQRAEKAEAERDADRKTLAEMVIQIRRRDEEARRAAEEKAAQLTAKGHSRGNSTERSPEAPPPAAGRPAGDIPDDSGNATGDHAEVPSLSRQNTITPATGTLSKIPQDQALMQSLPYASMIGVVLIGMGLMAYINGWQPQTRLDR